MALLLRFLLGGTVLCNLATGTLGESQSSPEPHLTIRQEMSIPFELKGGGFIMLPGSVNGMNGEFMFDMGTPFPFLLNERFVRLGPGGLAGHGKVSSGQKLIVHQHDVAEIGMLGDVKFHDIERVKAADFSFVAKGIGIADFLGFAGQPLVDETDFLIDYETHRIVLFANETATFEAAVEAVIPLNSRGTNPPVLFRVGDVDVNGFFDTGDLGGLTLTRVAKKSLLKRGALQKEGRHHGGMTYTLTGLFYDQSGLVLHGLQVKTGKVNRIGGYQFLVNFRTLWSFKKGTLTLFRRAGTQSPGNGVAGRGFD